MFRRDSAAGTGGGRSGFGLPRRYLNLLILVVLLILIATYSTPTTRKYVSPAHDSAYHPLNWIPDSIFNNLGFSGAGDAPKEFDDLGRCLFMSPFEALSQREQERASQVELENVSEGIVRAKQALFHHHATQGEQGNNSASAGGPVATLTNPILALLKDGERKWKDMVSGQSKTLEEAVEEYKIRWNRNPPLGFDEWYV
jgi:beta-1,2-xylosyltransferase